MRGLSLLVVSGAIVAAGCGLFSEDVELEISTDRTVYYRGSTINVTARNTSSDVIYYNSCMPTVLEQINKDRIVKNTGLPTCACLCITELDAGETWNWGIDVDWFWANEGMFEPEIGAKHRFRFAFYRDSDLKNLIRPDELITNTFRFENADAPVE
jgi:hypothetical protein